MLTQIGYIPNVIQTESVLEGLRRLIFIYPCILAIIAAITMGLFYKLSEKRFVQIINELNARKLAK